MMKIERNRTAGHPDISVLGISVGDNKDCRFFVRPGQTHSRSEWLVLARRIGPLFVVEDKEVACSDSVLSRPTPTSKASRRSYRSMTGSTISKCFASFLPPPSLAFMQSERPVTTQPNRHQQRTTAKAMFSLVAYIHSTQPRQNAAPSIRSPCTTHQTAAGPIGIAAQSKIQASPSSHSSPSSLSSPTADSVKTAKEQALASDFFYIGQ